MLGRLLLEDAEDLGVEGGVGVWRGEEGAEGVVAVGEEAEAELAAGGQAQAVAVGAEGVGEGGDEADRAHGAGETERLRRSGPRPTSAGSSGPKRASRRAWASSAETSHRADGLGWCRWASSR